MRKRLNVACACKLSAAFLDAGLYLHLGYSKSNSAKTRYTGSVTTLRTHIKRLGGEHYEMYRRSCHENGVTVHEAAVPDEVKGTESGKEMQQPITRYTQAEQKSTGWDKDVSIEHMLDFVIETDQVCGVLTNNHHTTPDFLIGPQCNEYTIIPKDDGISARREAQRKRYPARDHYD